MCIAKKFQKKIAMLAILGIIAVCMSGMIGLARAGAAKRGVYSRVAGSYLADSATTIGVYAEAGNTTNASKYLTINLVAYNQSGGIYDSARASTVTSAGGTLSRMLNGVPNDLEVRVHSTIYSGTSPSTATLEALSIVIN